MRFDDIRLTDLIGATGVYVIWDGKARAKPTYIGEGVILERLAQHAGRFAWPFEGYLAITGRWTSATAKNHAEILEALLLAVAKATDRLPNHNQAPGKTTAIQRIFRRHGVLRIRVTGYDPLLIPGQGRSLARAKVATLRFVADGMPYELEHEWRLRRLGQMTTV